MIWLLTTRDRETLCRQALESFYARAEGAFALIVNVDRASAPYGDLGPYSHALMRNAGIRDPMNTVYREFPEEDGYGWLSDDLIAETQGWNRKLANAAMDKLAFPSDGDGMRSPGRVTPGYVVPGDWVRAVGYWAPPYGMGIRGIETFWETVADKLDRKAYCPEVTLRHLHWMNKLRPKDDTDRAGWQSTSTGDYFDKPAEIERAVRLIRELDGS